MADKFIVYVSVVLVGCGIWDSKYTVSAGQKCTLVLLCVCVCVCARVYLNKLATCSHGIAESENGRVGRDLKRSLSSAPWGGLTDLECLYKTDMSNLWPQPNPTHTLAHSPCCYAIMALSQVCAVTINTIPGTGHSAVQAQVMANNVMHFDTLAERSPMDSKKYAPCFPLWSWNVRIGFKIAEK